MRLVDYIEGRKYKKCKVCNKSIKGKDKLAQHMKEEHFSDSY